MNEVTLYAAVSLARYRLREGAAPADAACVARLMQLDAGAVLTLAVRAENACAAVRVTLQAEKAGRALRGEEPST
jgi:hypothetical protein